MKKRALNFVLLLFFLISPFFVEANTTAYLPEKEKIEIRIYLPTASEVNVERKQDYRGQWHSVEKLPRLSNDDIQSINIENNNLVINIKQESWIKTRNLTTAYLKASVALMKNSRIVDVFPINAVMEKKIIIGPVTILAATIGSTEAFFLGMVKK
jgi:hypothetical protein